MRETPAFTPAPWRAVIDIAEHPQWFRVEADDGNICVPCYGRPERGIDKANAHLIAAAPAMYAALLAVEKASQDDMPPEVEAAIARQVSAALAQAEGRDAD